MNRNVWLSLIAAAVFAVALPGSASAAGCCQYRDDCKATDDADACEAAGGHHYQLGFCDGKTCHPTVAVPPRPISPVEPQGAVCLASSAQQLAPQASAAGWDCVTKDGTFCQGELGPGNRCVSSTTCTPEQTAECLPGFPMCPKVVPAPAPVPEY